MFILETIAVFKPLSLVIGYLKNVKREMMNSEVLRFAENAAASVAPDVLGSVNIANKMPLFAADNVVYITTGHEITHTILRQKIS